MYRRTFLGKMAAVAAGTVVPCWSLADETKQGPLTLVVMDPLAAPLACDCVQGYAQRKYEQLGAFLTQRLGRPVNVHWSESLPKALKEQTSGRADIVIGKHSVVLHDAREAKRKLQPAAALTGADGSTTQTGLLVVRSADPALEVRDLAGYRILFGPADCDEKSLAPQTLLRQHGVKLPENIETAPACSTAAGMLVELDPDVKAAAVISSYAEPLLEGCGTIKKGDLRVVGVSDPVPFITAFLSTDLASREQSQITAALLAAGLEPELLIALETAEGFVEYQPLPPPGSQTTPDAVSHAKKKD